MDAFAAYPIPAHAAGIGLKPAHYEAALATSVASDFFEVHAENFMGAGGPPHRWLTAFRAQFPIAIHGVCLSLGGREPLNQDHLRRLAALVERYEPALMSEHLAWSAESGFHYNDLLPPPLTEKSLARICEHVDELQEAVKRQVLIENPSSYLRIEPIEIAEPQFMNELASRTGCGILLDVNNVFVSAANLGFDAGAYVDAIESTFVGEIHLAGHAVDSFDGGVILVDDHGDHVCEEVLRLLERFVRRSGPRPTLIEWDTRIPAFEVLCAERAKASALLDGAVSGGRSHAFAR